MKVNKQKSVLKFSTADQDENKEVLSGLEAENELAPFGYIDQLTEEEQKQIRDKMLQVIQEEIRLKDKSEGKNSQWIRYISYAAALTFPILLTAFVWWANQPNVLIYQTQSNEKLDLKLPDGTLVALNSNSTLSFQKYPFKKFDRKVSFDGEGYFEVSKSEEPDIFIINAGREMEVKVLGTSFNLKSNHSKQHISLEKGVVKLGLKALDEELTMNPGDLVKYDPKDKQLEIIQLPKPEMLSAWKEGTLRLHNDHLENILSVVAEIYDLQFQDWEIEHNSLAVSGTLPLGPYYQEVLENLKLLYEVDFTETEINQAKNSSK